MKKDVEGTISAARDWLLSQQQPDGYWCADLGCDASVTAEGLFLRHLLGRVDPERQELTVAWILRQQGPDGGWPIYFGGPSEVNVTVKCYLALKLAGLDPDAPVLQRAREAARRLGGVEACHLFTQIYLAWGGLYPWSSVPRLPIEVLSVPQVIFSRYDLSYWARTIVVPLLVTLAYRPVFPVKVDIAELFTGRKPPEGQGQKLEWWQSAVIQALEGLLDFYDRHHLKGLRQKALKEAEAWFVERFAHSDGLGAIWPAMVNAAVALVCQGHGPDSPQLQTALKELDRLDVVTADGAWTQPCLSPVWDTLWAMKALLASGMDPADEVLERSARWILTKQSLIRGDWAENTAPDVPAGGWFFQYENAYYPDVDDTGAVLMVLRQLPLRQEPDVASQMEVALAWIRGMQNQDGGWGAFDRTPRDRTWLNYFSFARPFQGALLDPSTADVSARCVAAFGELGLADSATARRGLAYLRAEQEPDGSWFGRWGVNYVYGTWSVLSAFEACGVEPSDPAVRAGAAYLKRTQLPDGGWGETCETYDDPRARAKGPSTPSQTAWALLGLMSAGETDGPEVARGIRYLLDRQTPEGTWDEPDYTGTGFPRVFYLHYGMYAHYFPMMALSRYRASLVAKPREMEIGG